MAVVTTNLGTVTAYGDAVAAGYTGTKEQWQALMADYATVGTQAAQDAQTATTAAQTATTKAGEASASATAAAASAASIGTPDTTLTQSGKAADAKAVGDELSTIKEDLNEIASRENKTFDFKRYPSEASDNYGGGYYDSNGAWIVETTTGYWNYVLNSIDRNYSLYFEDVHGYWQICIYNGAISTSNFVARKRSTDSSLPTALNPITIAKNQTVVISRGGTSNTTANVITDWSSNLLIRESAVEPATVSIVSKIGKPLILYTTPNTNYITEQLSIFMPCNNGYIRYDLGHVENNLINADIWHIVQANYVDSSLENPIQLTTTGEWECAVKLHGRSNHSGGAAHGNEIMDNISFFVNNAIVDITDYSVPTQVNSLRVIQTSNLYDPNDNSSLIATHGEQYIFDDGCLDIKQSVKWEVAEQIDSCYMAMFPVSKSVTNNLYTDKDFTIKNLPAVVTAKNATMCYIYSDDFTAEFAIAKYPTKIDSSIGGDRFLCTDNGGGLYNKCYYQISKDNGSGTTAVDDIWMSETIYRLDYKAAT